jgi:hypothetical protein
MILNKVVACILSVFIYFLVRNACRINANGRPDLRIEKIRTLGAAFLLLLLAIGFLVTKRDFCALVPFFCK